MLSTRLMGLTFLASLFIQGQTSRFTCRVILSDVTKVGKCLKGSGPKPVSQPISHQEKCSETRGPQPGFTVFGGKIFVFITLHA